MAIQGAEVERQGEAEAQDLEDEGRNSDRGKAQSPYEYPCHSQDQRCNES